MAVGASIEHVSVSGSTTFSGATRDILAGSRSRSARPVPSPWSRRRPPLGCFWTGNPRQTVFAVVPTGNIKVGYDITDMLSLTLAYNYCISSSVGRTAGRIASPADIRQSVFSRRGSPRIKAKFYNIGLPDIAAAACLFKRLWRDRAHRLAREVPAHPLDAARARRGAFAQGDAGVGVQDCFEAAVMRCRGQRKPMTSSMTG